VRVLSQDVTGSYVSICSILTKLRAVVRALYESRDAASQPEHVESGGHDREAVYCVHSASSHPRSILYTYACCEMKALWHLVFLTSYWLSVRTVTCRLKNKRAFARSGGTWMIITILVEMRAGHSSTRLQSI
jgi:hypothetical protein